MLKEVTIPQLIERYKAMPDGERYKHRSLAAHYASNSPAYQDRDFNLMLLTEMQRVEKELKAASAAPDLRYPEVTFVGTLRAMKPIFYVVVIGAAFWGVGAAIVGIGLSLKAFFTKYAMWIIGGILAVVLFRELPALNFSRDESEGDGVADDGGNQNVIVNVFTSKNGDVKVDKTEN